MKNLEDCGNPAFPTFDGDTYNGMSLRDWFAGMALQGRLAAGQRVHVESDAYEDADAMLKARNK